MLRLASIVTIALLTLTFACGDDGVGNGGDVVGGACVDNGDCAERCQLGGDFPQGTCTVTCNTDNDCPGGTYCIDTEGGICLLGCDTPSDCRGGYNCEGKTNRTHGGDSLVCVN